VKVCRVDVYKKQVDFEIAAPEEPEKRPKEKGFNGRPKRPLIELDR
jgi:hypothetical protein